MLTRNLILPVLFLSLISCTPAVEPSAAESPAAQSGELTQKLDATLDAIYENDAPGATVMISREGEPLYSGARGMADLELGVAMEPEHILKIGSVTKQFTAAAILKLAEQNKLSVDDAVGTILPDFHEPELTIHQLLNHTSGLPSYTDNSEYMMGNGIRADVTAAEIIALTSDLPLQFIPGEDWRYSNSGYVVLGAVIEELSGKSWHAFIDEQLLQPLQLQKTGYFHAAEIVPGRVPGYMFEGGFINAPYISMTQPHAAGAFSATATELDRWQRALHGGEVLSEQSYQQMIDARGGLNDYAYGVGVSTLQGHKMISHGGGIHGFNAYALWLPETQVSVVVLSNRMAPGMGAGEAAMRLAAIALDQPFPIEKATVDLPPELYDAIIGTYRVDEQTSRVIFSRDNSLYSKRGDGQAFALRYVGDDQFVYTDSLTYFEVLRDANGAVEGLNFYPADQDMPDYSEKVSDEVQLRQAITLDDEQIARLVGDYQLQPGFVISIRHTDAGITAQATNQSAFLVEASSPTVLFSEQFGIVMEFELPEQGAATQLNLLQGGQNLPAPRIEDKEDE